MADEREKNGANDSELNDYLDLLNQYTPEKTEAEVSDETAGDTPEEIATEKTAGETPEETVTEETGGETPEKPEIPEGPKSKNPFKRIAAWYKRKTKKKRIVLGVIAIILCLVLIFLIFAWSFIAGKLGRLGKNYGSTPDADDDKIYEDEDFGSFVGKVDSTDFEVALKDWATSNNDKIMSSKNVVNVLLIGADSRYGKNEGNTDTMMLISLNRKTKKITMVSFFRDSYLYIQGDTESRCDKLNAAFSMGGPECLLKTIENNFKIDIDNYVMVNFESFAKIIDAMGGVTVNVQKYEADYIKKRFDVDIGYGENQKLDGDEALCFCRIRYCDADGDVSRTRRQREVINAIMDEAKSASVTKLNKYVNALLPYVYTGFSNTQIVSYGLRALTQGWASYDRTQLQIPPENARMGGNAGSAWIWVVDYQLCAQTLQQAIYGNSDIVLEKDRKTLIDVYKRAHSSSTGSSTSSSSGTKTTTTASTTKSSGTETTTAPVVTKVEITVPKPTETVPAPATTTPAVTEKKKDSNQKQNTP